MKHWYRVLIGAAIVALMFLHALGVRELALLTRLDYIFYDAKVRLTMPNTVDDRVVVLDIDEKSLAKEGHWPWRRDKMAAIMEKLFDFYGVRIVGFDVVFPEPDTSSGYGVLQELAKHELRGNQEYRDSLVKLKGTLDFDQRFANAIRNRSVVLGYVFLGEKGSVSSGTLPQPVLQANALPSGLNRSLLYNGYAANIKVLQDAAIGGGHFVPHVDIDGIVRRAPMLAEYQGGLYESLSMAMVRRIVGATEVVPGRNEAYGSAEDGAEWIDLRTEKGGTLRIPVDPSFSVLASFRGPERSFPYYSLTDVLNGEIEKEKLQGRIALVGTTAAGLKDLRATPVAGIYPGVEVHANLITGILDGTLRSTATNASAADALTIAFFGLLFAFLLPRLSVGKATVATALLVSLVIGANLYFWQAENTVVPLAGLLSTLLLIYVLNMTLGFFFESRSKRQFTQLFGQYVPPELVDEMAKNPESYSMDGRKEELTVLFSDVRGFTTISEGLQPDQLAALMNEYLGAMTKVIRGHRGTLDKYIGDAIMAFWGAPIADPDHAFHAVVTALEMQVGMTQLNVELLKKGWPELKIGVGVNTGSMTVGDMGSPVRKAYTVMGDAVNLGSRLEGITKQYGVGVIVGEETYRKVMDRFEFRELDRVRVKGKAEPVGIYEPLGLSGKLDTGTMTALLKWNEVLRAYRSQEWDRAESMLAELEAAEPHYLYELYRERIAHHRVNPPGEEWDGVTKFETK